MVVHSREETSSLIAEAQHLYSQGSFTECVTVCKRILEVLANPHTYVLLGACCFSLGALDQCVQHNLAALAIDRNYAEAYCNLGNALCKLDRVGEAIELYRTAAVLKPSLIEAHSNLGSAFTALGRHTEAIEVYRTALNLNPFLRDTQFRSAGEGGGVAEPAARSVRTRQGPLGPDGTR